MWGPVRRLFANNHRNTPHAGGFDRTHNGLVSGWFTCSTCGQPPTPAPDLVIDGQPMAVTKSTTPRGDVPGHRGFLLRFAPTATTNPHIRIQCPDHPEQGLDLRVPAETWSTTALAAIETSTWPVLTGWIALVAVPDGAVRLEIDGYGSWPIRATVRRPDVQTYLGSHGVGGFKVDLGGLLGYTLPDGTQLEVTASRQLLAQAIVKDSPLGEDVSECLASRSSGTSGDVDASSVHELRRRFAEAKVNINGDWRDILDVLGQREYTAETEQWADYLTHQSQSPQQAAAWLALRAAHALGVPSLNPLPDELDETLALEDAHLPERVRIWTAPVMGIGDRIDESDRQAASVSTPASDVSDRKVAVAGLVRHKSGLGQNARNSLKALELAGIHACPTPFFPSPGGWNPRLGLSREAVRALEDHTVLLHLPIDEVIPSLAAQPALLSTDRLIGYFMWELEMVPRQFHRALDVVDEIWTATEFVADAFRRVTDTPIYVTGHAVDVSSIEEVTHAEMGIDEDAFVVHYSFDANSTVARKNPNAALDAFHLAFRDDPTAVFVLKIRNFQQVESLARQGDPHSIGLLRRLEAHPGVVLVTGEWSYPRALGLIAMADCYISLHRSEGYGYGVVEALKLDTPVVLTDYSGISDCLDEDSLWRVSWERIPVYPGEYFVWEQGATWAEPSIECAARHLQAVRSECELPHLEPKLPTEIGQSLETLKAEYSAHLMGSQGSGTHE